MSKAMEHEHKLLTKRRMLKETARKKYDELDVIFQQVIESNAWTEAHKKYDELDSIVQQIKEVNKKIEEQRQKQEIEQ